MGHCPPGKLYPTVAPEPKLAVLTRPLVLNQAGPTPQNEMRSRIMTCDLRALEKEWRPPTWKQIQVQMRCKRGFLSASARGGAGGQGRGCGSVRRPLSSRPRPFEAPSV